MNQHSATWEGMFSQATRSVNYWIFTIAFLNLNVNMSQMLQKKVSKRFLFFLIKLKK